MFVFNLLKLLIDLNIRISVFDAETKLNLTPFHLEMEVWKENWEYRLYTFSKFQKEFFKMVHENWIIIIISIYEAYGKCACIYAKQWPFTFPVYLAYSHLGNRHTFYLKLSQMPWTKPYIAILRILLKIGNIVEWFVSCSNWILFLASATKNETHWNLCFSSNRLYIYFIDLLQNE